MALSFLKPLAADFIILNPAYNTPAWTLVDVQDLIDYVYMSYPTIECLSADMQPTAFRLAIAHEAEQTSTQRLGYGGIVKSISSRNDRIEYSLSKEGWVLENSLAGSRLAKMLRSSCGNGIFVGRVKSNCGCG